MTDDKIIELFVQRSEEAIKETINKYNHYCFKISNNILNNIEDSEECVNDTWMKAWNSIPPTSPKYLNLFLAKIVRNLSFNKYRAKYTNKRGNGEVALVLDELEECIAGQSDVEKNYIAEELQATINEFVRNLPEKEGNIFVRRYFYSDSIKDISKMYNVSENNISVMLNRTRGKLKSLLESEEYI